MHPQETELDDVLAQLTGTGLYRNNVFRLTGLSAGATPAQIRRRREEVTLSARLGTPLAPPSGELLLAPSADAEAVNAAFDALRNPVLRIVHETLWLWGGDNTHDEAVRTHCAVIEEESIPVATRPDVEEDPLAKRWVEALSSWAKVLDSEDFWDRVKDRVAALDDPRLTTGTVRRLRLRLPSHLIGVSVAFAMKAVEDVGTDEDEDEVTAAGDRHLWLLDESPFDEKLVDRALRDAARPAEDRVRASCETAATVANTSPKESPEAGRALLRQSELPLRLLAVLLGPEDAVTTAARDEVAKAANMCAVANHNETSACAPALALLNTARELGVERTTLELIERNLEVINSRLVVSEVEDLCLAGSVDAAADRLRAWRAGTADEELAGRIDDALKDPTVLLRPANGRVPFQGSLFGFGAKLMGRRAATADGRYITTHFVTLLFFPVIPMAAYLRDTQWIYGKAPMSALTRWWRLVALTLIAVYFAAHWGSTAIAGVLTAVIVVTATALLIRKQKLAAWVDERTLE